MTVVSSAFTIVVNGAAMRAAAMQLNNSLCIHYLLANHVFIENFKTVAVVPLLSPPAGGKPPGSNARVFGARVTRAIIVSQHFNASGTAPKFVQLRAAAVWEGRFLASQAIKDLFASAL
jgi:hypothetical protein